MLYSFNEVLYSSKNDWITVTGKNVMNLESKMLKKSQKRILYDFSYKNFKMKWNQPRVWKVRIGFTLEGTMRGAPTVGNDPFCVLSVGYMSRFTL